MVECNYQVFDPAGELVFRAPERLRYDRTVERSLLESGYSIRLNGAKISLRQLRKEADCHGSLRTGSQ